VPNGQSSKRYTEFWVDTREPPGRSGSNPKTLELKPRSPAAEPSTSREAAYSNASADGSCCVTTAKEGPQKVTETEKARPRLYRKEVQEYDAIPTTFQSSHHSDEDLIVQPTHVEVRALYQCVPKETANCDDGPFELVGRLFTVFDAAGENVEEHWVW